MDDPIADYRFEDLEEGQQFFFDVTVGADDIDRYAALSGDVGPLHMDADFAMGCGFAGRVAHGTLLASYISRIVGVYCPGRNALLHSIDLKFLSPVYAEETIRISAIVDRISSGTKVVMLKVTVENAATAHVCVRGKVQIGFTQEAL
jgi:3-hydroxybutyryl-CoA dehydratase